MLEYDNSAFYYFALTLIRLVLLPQSGFVVADVARALCCGPTQKKARTSMEREALKKQRETTRGPRALANRSFFFRLLFVALGWLVVMSISSNMGDNQEIGPSQHARDAAPSSLILDLIHAAECSVLRPAPYPRSRSRRHG